MDLKNLEWSQTALDFFGVNRSCLADEIVSNSELIGHISSGPLKGTPITALIGDQHAALVGQKCLSQGLVRLISEAVKLENSFADFDPRAKAPTAPAASCCTTPAESL